MYLYISEQWWNTRILNEFYDGGSYGDKNVKNSIVTQMKNNNLTSDFHWINWFRKIIVGYVSELKLVSLANIQ